MWVVGRILLVILMVIGVLLVAAGTASLVGADSWTGQIYDINIDSGVFMGVGDGGVALGVILLAASIIMKLRPTNLYFLPAF
ncbi:MAG TPA: hypothetical protein VMX96_07590 [Dehalococcoidia bacterium]|nr:hypothetical protein [Dehalococcoidia bacterium]